MTGTVYAVPTWLHKLTVVSLYLKKHIRDACKACCTHLLSAIHQALKSAPKNNNSSATLPLAESILLLALSVQA